MAPPQGRVATALSSRWLDILYVVFISFVCFFPFLYDFAGYYPVPDGHWSRSVHDHLIKEMNDPLFANNPPWFVFYTAMEAVYLVPHGLWCVRGLVLDDAMAPFHLMLWAAYMLQSCAVCWVEIVYAHEWPQESIEKTLPGYIGCFVISAVMFVDKAWRVRSVMLQKEKAA